MIPTNKKHFNKGEIILNPFINDLYIASMGCTCYDNEIPQHLYITSNEEIKEGEYGLSALNKVVVIGKLYKKSLYKKIIATTDTSLQYAIDKSPYNMEIYGLPQLPQQFIEDYIKEYNKGNVITDVEVEYVNTPNSVFISEIDAPYIQLKINSDNTININSIKDSWSREEVKQLLNKFSIDCFKIAKESVIWGEDYPQIVSDKWIEENL